MMYSKLIFLLLIFGTSCSENDFTNSLPTPNVSLGLVGDSTDVITSSSAGTVIMGGSRDVDEAILWMINRSGGGDFIVIRAKGTNAYNDYIFGLGDVNSVETLLIDSREDASAPDVIQKIQNAEALFIAGGNQFDYVSFWKDTPLEDAINYLKNDKKVPVGGTSAGAAIMGDFYFDAANGTIYSEEALQNPFDSLISIQGGNFIENKYLINTITDTHYSQRDRQGRHITFIARIIHDLGRPAKGIGVDERTAVCIDENGIATVFGTNMAYFIDGSTSNPEIIIEDQPLHWYNQMKALKVFEIQGSENGQESFDLKSWESENSNITGYWYVENGDFKGF
ncbi:MAG: cyanophycinase [Balneolaceae bacterium]|nr:cyanophycinase [Balneolaceae bacterium]MBO6546754.1 cyanophycinase [Balneolaceae bacterium]MBO6649112.1 cyanophycinase [Balneolaceae bacterium]